MIRIDDLEIRGYKIYQDTDKFCFGIDAVLLANFFLRNFDKKIIKNKKLESKDKIYNLCDLCSGNFIIPTIIYAKKNLFVDDIKMTIASFEIDSEQVELAKKTVALNKQIDKNFEKDTNIINDDINNIINDKNKYNNLYGTFDFITCNPPYVKKNSGLQNENESMNIARQEIKIDFSTIAKIASLLLKSKKSFYLINQSKRLSEIIYTLKNNQLEPKTIQFVHPYKNKKSNLVLIEAVKDGKEETKVLEPITVYSRPNEYTAEVLEIYGK
jgi:tRNA1(Val) A37 N6-methylase TrmN6